MLSSTSSSTGCTTSFVSAPSSSSTSSNMSATSWTTTSHPLTSSQSTSSAECDADNSVHMNCSRQPLAVTSCSNQPQQQQQSVLPDYNCNGIIGGNSTDYVNCDDRKMYDCKPTPPMMYDDVSRMCQQQSSTNNNNNVIMTSLRPSPSSVVYQPTLKHYTDSYEQFHRLHYPQQQQQQHPPHHIHPSSSSNPQQQQIQQLQQHQHQQQSIRSPFNTSTNAVPSSQQQHQLRLGGGGVDSATGYQQLRYDMTGALNHGLRYPNMSSSMNDDMNCQTKQVIVHTCLIETMIN